MPFTPMSDKRHTIKIEQELFLAHALLTLLISNAARSFAGGLTRSLALAAAACLRTFFQITSFDSLNSLHKRTTSFI